MYAAIIILIIALIYVATAMPKTQSQKPPGLGDIQAPTTEEGTEIAVLFGTRDIKGPMIVWYGDYSTVPVKK